MPSGVYVPGSEAERRLRRPKGVDLFCGIGGMSLGAMQAGMEIVAALDNDPSAAITYLHNLGAYPVELHFADDDAGARFERALAKEFKRAGVAVGRDGVITETGGGTVSKPVPVSGGNAHRVLPAGIPPVPHLFFGDVRKFTGAQILAAAGLAVGELDCVMGGPPCQGFSTAGRQNVMDPRNSLVFEFARLVVEMRPKTMIFENVPGILQMVTPEGLPVVDALCRVLEDGGFAGYDALRKAMAAQTGAFGAVRGKPKQKRAKARKPPPADDQLALGVSA